MATGTEPESGLGEEEVEYEEVEEEVEYEEGEEEVEEQEDEPEAGDDSKLKESDSETENKSPEVAEAEASTPADKEDAESEQKVPPPPASKPAKDAPASADDAASDKPSAAAGSSTSSEPGAASGGADASSSSVGGDEAFKNLEAQAAKVAQAAKDMSSKLTAGLRSAFGGGGGGGAAESATAGASLSKLAGGLTSWWGSLDPAPQPVRDETAERVASSNKASSELQQLFGLSAEENLVEHFKCKLLQTYACSHNSHTPAIQMAFQGTLYVTDKHTCFSVEERGRKLPFKVPHSAVVKATRQRPARKGDLSDLLKMELGNGQWLAFKDFDSGSALDSALALVEHLMEGH
ncbi:hypothetical protein HYH02_008349 [Chlamydomonas schloesseri]|uniref:GRAM domain-containing protein n=1 Tax=Chlamydomonas schloesseri TaxID=2026947 RepID=A0A835WFU7_9CHLO|nr:hypothetical protein HYH02_008349 [Chlamydomonas schloesseri]|eukprot:KAG2446789.1 hypothetical protein HYH02_008349 [Chlamydomonas schloesseri]